MSYWPMRPPQEIADERSKRPRASVQRLLESQAFTVGSFEVTANLYGSVIVTFIVGDHDQRMEQAGRAAKLLRANFYDAAMLSDQDARVTVRGLFAPVY